MKNSLMVMMARIEVENFDLCELNVTLLVYELQLLDNDCPSELNLPTEKIGAIGLLDISARHSLRH